MFNAPAPTGCLMSRAASRLFPEPRAAGSPGIPAERRTSHRYRALDYVARLDSAALHVPVRVTNLSNGGALVAGSALPAVGEQVRLHFDCTRLIEGRIAWASEGQAGIRFFKDMACEAFFRDLVSSRLNATSRMPRIPVQLAARIKGGPDCLAVVVDNISQKGLRVTHKGGLFPGARVQVALAGGTCEQGTVRWVNARSAGIELAGKLTAANLEALATSHLRPVRALCPISAQPHDAKEKFPRLVR
jgi:hypothetical protein